MINFNRQYEFSAGIPNKKGFHTSSLRVLFNIEKSATSSPSSSQITLYNLSPENRSILNLDDCIVEFKAGYGSNTPLIATGNISFVVTRPEGADESTDIEFIDGRVPIRDTYISLSYSGTVNRMLILVDIARQMGLTLSISSKAKFGDYRMGYSFIGQAATALKKICAADGLRWSIQLGVLQIVVANQPFNEKRVFEISPATGLIGVPEAFTLGAKTRNKKGKNTTVNAAHKGWRVSFLLNPFIGINDYVKLSSSVVDGFFRVYKINMIGDTHGEDWKCDAELFAPGVDVSKVGEGYAE